MANHPLAEVFGFPCDNISAEAQRYRKLKLCPFQNNVPSCTKDKADNPLGVCSVIHGNKIAITCPARFRQDWLIAEDSANFFFPEGTSWTSLTEVRLNDKNGDSAGNIDVVLVAYNADGKVIDFGALEIQGVYISGNVRRPFEHYMKDPKLNANMDWRKETNYPRPDYLSSSRKRLVPQLLYKGSILNAWKKKVAVALDETFFATLPELKQVDEKKADIVWLVYSMALKATDNTYSLKRVKKVFTLFSKSIDQIARPEIGDPEIFIGKLQEKLDEQLDISQPETNTLDIKGIGDIGTV